MGINRITGSSSQMKFLSGWHSKASHSALACCQEHVPRAPGELPVYLQPCGCGSDPRATLCLHPAQTHVPGPFSCPWHTKGNIKKQQHKKLAYKSHDFWVLFSFVQKCSLLVTNYNFTSPYHRLLKERKKDAPSGKFHEQTELFVLLEVMSSFLMVLTKVIYEHHPMLTAWDGYKCGVHAFHVNCIHDETHVNEISWTQLGHHIYNHRLIFINLQ